MAFSHGNHSVTLEDILNKTTESNILSFYLGVTHIPCLINSPLREDKHPSFSLYSFDGKKIYYIDFSTRERGSIFDLLGKMWGCSYIQVLSRILKDLQNLPTNTKIKKVSCTVKKLGLSSKTDIQCKIREWREYDLEYWESYGISLKWLKYADVYPISHTIIIKEGYRYVLSADKLAYAFVERKEGKITMKIYQPLNKKGHKWCSKHDSSVISLWTKIPEYGDKMCMCSSLKDALCLWANIGIPAVSLQGEGYKISNTALNELRRRYKKIYICLDNDKPGIEDAKKLSEETGFTNVVLPYFEEGKDISDLMKAKGREEFKRIILPLFS